MIYLTTCIGAVVDVVDYARGRMQYRVELKVIDERVKGFRLNWSDVRFLRLNGCGVIR